MEKVFRVAAPVLAAVVLIAAALAPAPSHAGYRYHHHRHYHHHNNGGNLAAGIFAGLATAMIASSVARPAYATVPNYGYATVPYGNNYGAYQQTGFYDNEVIVVNRRPRPVYVQPRPMYAYPMYEQPRRRWCRDRFGHPVKCFYRPSRYYHGR